MKMYRLTLTRAASSLALYGVSTSSVSLSEASNSSEALTASLEIMVRVRELGA